GVFSVFFVDRGHLPSRRARACVLLPCFPLFRPADPLAYYLFWRLALETPLDSHVSVSSSGATTLSLAL
ncbi:MAG: hypothetical protein ACK55I_02410, partial [bacterium]